MKVLFFTPTNIYSNLAEIELELMQRHLDDGDEVHAIICNGNLSFCEINPGHKKLQCSYCMAKHKNMFALPDGKIHTHHLKRFYRETEDISNLQTEFTSIEDLKNYKWDDHFDIGYSIGSYLISEFRDPHLDITPHLPLIKTLLQTSLHLYLAVQRFLTHHKMDKVYVWNGRMPTMRPVIRAAASKQINFATFNTGSSAVTFETFDNSLIHDLSATANKIIQYWNNSTASVEEKTAAGAAFFIRRTKKAPGDAEAVNRFIQNQETEKLPDDWDPAKTNISIFNSSEDEMASISDEWKNHLYHDQYDGLCRLIHSIESDQRFNNHHFYLRIHPNLSNINNADVKRITGLRSSKLTIIPGSSAVSTYFLIQQSDKVVTFGSSAGIEAVFMEKPSLLIGKCFYRNLPGGTYQPASHDEFIELLLQPLKALDKTAALMYGYFWSTYGTPLKYVDKKEKDWFFRGKKLRSHPVYEGLKSLKGTIKK